jgi:hypothetical protein
MMLFTSSKLPSAHARRSFVAFAVEPPSLLRTLLEQLITSLSEHVSEKFELLLPAAPWPILTF